MRNLMLALGSLLMCGIACVELVIALTRDSTDSSAAFHMSTATYFLLGGFLLMYCYDHP